MMMMIILADKNKEMNTIIFNQENHKSIKVMLIPMMVEI
jgi:hypothetical protein